MQKIRCKLTVFFDEPFWVGVYERIWDGNLEACKITFGREPKDYEVYEFMLYNWHNLQFSPPVKEDRNREKRVNPKRTQRAIKRQLETKGIGTKSQQALKLQHEKGKETRQEKNRIQKEEEKQRKFDLCQQKRKEKHKGR